MIYMQEILKLLLQYLSFSESYLKLFQYVLSQLLKRKKS